MSPFKREKERERERKKERERVGLSSFVWELLRKDDKIICLIQQFQPKPLCKMSQGRNITWVLYKREMLECFSLSAQITN